MAGAGTSPVTLWRRKAAEAEAVRWDGTPEVLAVLAAWGAEPAIGFPGPGGAVLIWSSRHGYSGALPGDWLVRDRTRQGATRFTPAAFADAFEASAASGPVAAGASELAAAGLADARERLARVREIAGNFIAAYGHSQIPMFRVGQDLANSIVKILDAPPGDGDGEPGPPRRLSMPELWEQAGGNGERYMELLREHGHVLVPGDDAYEQAAPGVLPCRGDR